MNLMSKLVMIATVLWLPVQGIAGTEETAGFLKLEYTDGRAATVGVDEVNDVLRSVGVRVSTVPLPEKALPLLEVSHSRAITEGRSQTDDFVFRVEPGRLACRNQSRRS